MDGEKRVYKSSVVSAMCQILLKEEIDSQRFSKWRKNLGVEGKTHYLTEKETLMLIKYAELRKTFGYQMQYNGEKQRITKSIVRVLLQDCHNDPNWLRKLKVNLDEAIITKDEVKPTQGKHLPSLVLAKTGKVITLNRIRQIFREWGQSLKANEIYDEYTIYRLLSRIQRKSKLAA